MARRWRPRWDDRAMRDQWMARDMEYEMEFERRARAYEYERAYRRRISEMDGYWEALREKEIEELARIRRQTVEREKRLVVVEHGHQPLHEREGFPENAPIGTEPGVPLPTEENEAAYRTDYLNPHQGGEWMPDGGEPVGQGIHEGGAVDMDVEEEEDEATKEGKRVFKLKRYSSIPLSYSGPMFDDRFNDFLVVVSPVVYMDVCSPSFKTEISDNAAGMKLNLGTGEGDQQVNSLTLLAKDKSIRVLLKGLMSHNFKSESFAIKVEQRHIDDNDVVEPDCEFQFHRNIGHKATFNVINRSICNCAKEPPTANESSEAMQSALTLHNLPKNVDWTFLRTLIPFSLKGQVIEGGVRSAVVQMNSSKMARVYQKTIQGMEINGQSIFMKTDVLSEEAARMLREAEEFVPPPEPTVVKKTGKKMAPSDVRRNLQRKIKWEERSTFPPFPPIPPPFPGVENLMHMSFMGPGNFPGAPPSAFSGRGARGAKMGYRAFTAEAQAGAEDPMSDENGEFPVVPIPQMLEGPYPAESEYYGPGTVIAPGTSQKVRAAGYYRRRGARVSVHLCHLWGNNLQLAAKALANAALPDDQREVLQPPPEMLCTRPLTEAQMKKLRKSIKENVSMDEMKRAEEHWHRKRKEREAKGLTMTSNQGEAEAMSDPYNPKQKTAAHIERDRQRMTQYNAIKNKDKEHAPEETASAGRQGFNSAPATIKASGFQKRDGSASQTGSWNKQQPPAKTDTSSGGPKKWGFFQPPSSKAGAAQNQKGGWNQPASNQYQNQDSWSQPAQSQYQDNSNWNQPPQTQQQGTWSQPPQTQQQGTWSQPPQTQQQGTWSQPPQNQEQGNWSQPPQNQNQYQKSWNQPAQNQYQESWNQPAETQNQNQGDWNQGSQSQNQNQSWDNNWSQPGQFAAPHPPRPVHPPQTPPPRPVPPPSPQTRPSLRPPPPPSPGGGQYTQPPHQQPAALRANRPGQQQQPPPWQQQSWQQQQQQPQKEPTWWK